MYCSTCGTLITQNLNYCNRCGARVENLAATDKSATATTYLSMATGFVGLGGLGLTVGLIALLIKSGIVIEAVVILALAFLVAVCGITFMMLRQIAQMNRALPPAKENFADYSRITAANTAQLEEPRQPAQSVTENTTRTLEKELVK